MKIYAALISFILHVDFINALTDLTPAAITVYRNREFFKNLNQPDNIYHHKQGSKKTPDDYDENYQYPGETKKPNVPGGRTTDFEVTYDDSPEFHHEPRDIFVSSFVPKRRKGPYSPYKILNTYGENYNENTNFGEFSEANSMESDTNEQLKKIFSDIDNNDMLDAEVFHYGHPSFFTSGYTQDFDNAHESLFATNSPFESQEVFNYEKNSNYQSQPRYPLSFKEWKQYAFPNLKPYGALKSGFSVGSSEESTSNNFESDDFSHEDDVDDKEPSHTNSYVSSEYESLNTDDSKFNYMRHPKTKYPDRKKK